MVKLSCILYLESVKDLHNSYGYSDGSQKSLIVVDLSVMVTFGPQFLTLIDAIICHYCEISPAKV